MRRFRHTVEKAPSQFGWGVPVWNIGSTQRDGRVRVEVIDDGLEPSYECSARIQKILYQKLEPTGYNGKSVSQETQNFYFEEFKKFFVWKQEDDIIHDGWLTSARRKYSEVVSVARSNWEKNKKQDTRIGKNVYASWIKFWESKKFQKLKFSLSAPTADQLFYETHTRHVKKKKNFIGEGDDIMDDESEDEEEVVWIDKKSQQTYETFLKLRELHEAAGQPVDNNALFLEAVGGLDKKKRVYGVGSSKRIFYQSKNKSCTSSFAFAGEEENQRLKRQLL
ncbi:uncharacterized protein LOC141673154 [Apium graveolens]|uniref:uncharacterized protein LOC141673154 n=1 Tax=Apium graveolens TaxID=4045 RepID=UPI003D7AEFA5